jgi:hypothetical protein
MTCFTEDVVVDGVWLSSPNFMTLQAQVIGSCLESSFDVACFCLWSRDF